MAKGFPYNFQDGLLDSQFPDKPLQSLLEYNLIPWLASILQKIDDHLEKTNSNTWILHSNLFKL